MCPDAMFVPHAFLTALPPMEIDHESLWDSSRAAVDGVGFLEWEEDANSLTTKVSAATLRRRIIGPELMQPEGRYWRSPKSSSNRREKVSPFSCFWARLSRSSRVRTSPPTSLRIMFWSVTIVLYASCASPRLIGPAAR